MLEVKRQRAFPKSSRQRRITPAVNTVGVVIFALVVSFSSPCLSVDVRAAFHFYANIEPS